MEERGGVSVCDAAVSSDPASADVSHCRHSRDGGALSSDGAGALSSDGAGALSSDGAGALSSDGAGVLSSDGAGALSSDGGGALSSDGAGALSSDGAGALSSDGGGALSSDGGGWWVSGDSTGSDSPESEGTAGDRFPGEIPLLDAEYLEQPILCRILHGSRGCARGGGAVHREQETGTQRPMQCRAVQTEVGMQDAETSTERDAVRVLKELVRRREQLKESYQEVLDRQAQAENQLQVQIKQLKQQREDERGEHQETLRSIQEVTVRREEAKKRMEKERKEQSQKEQDVRAEQEKLQSKREGLKQEQTELERKIGTLLAEQAKEKQEWDAELASLTKLDNEVMQSVVRETERAARAEVLSLESRRDLLLVSLEEAENEAEATLSFLKAAPPTLEWLQLKQQWEARMAGVQQLKGNLRDQFDTQIQHVRNGSMLGSLPIISPPKLPSPPSETNLMLQRIALMNPQVPAPVPSRNTFYLQAQIPCHPPPPRNLGPIAGTHPAVPRAPGTELPPPQGAPTHKHPTVPRAPGTELPPPADKLSKILEKLWVRFPHCNKAHLTGIMQQIKGARGTLSGLTVEELCQLVAARLVDSPDHGAAGTLPNTRPPFHIPQSSALFLPQAACTGRPPQYPTPFKLCLMCQQLVQPTDLHPMSCTHTMHRECIKFWAQTNQKHSCPFCPSQR